MEGLAAPRVCSNCGAASQARDIFCAKCGNRIFPGSGVPEPATPFASPSIEPEFSRYLPYETLPRAVAASHQKQIARSRNGILLLLVGALLSWIPFIDLLGGFLTFVGAILVIRGRKAFGPIHRRNVKQAIGLFVAGVAFTVVGGFIAIIVALRGTTVSEQAFTAGLRDAILYTLLIGVLGTVVANLASVFFIYALQRKEGRIALWAAYVSTIGIQIAILSAVLPRIPDLASSIAREVYGAGTFDATQMSMAIAGATGYLAWLNVIPAALYATANYLAWSRIAKGEIPAALKILGST